MRAVGVGTGTARQAIAMVGAIPVGLVHVDLLFCFRCQLVVERVDPVQVQAPDLLSVLDELGPDPGGDPTVAQGLFDLG